MGRFRFCGQIWLVSNGKCSLKAAVPETYHFKQTSFDYIKLHAYFVAKTSKITIMRIFCRENYNYAHILSRKLQLRAYFVAKTAKITIKRFGGQAQLTKYDGGQVRGL